MVICYDVSYVLYAVRILCYRRRVVPLEMYAAEKKIYCAMEMTVRAIAMCSRLRALLLKLSTDNANIENIYAQTLMHFGFVFVNCVLCFSSVVNEV